MATSNPEDSCSSPSKSASSDSEDPLSILRRCSSLGQSGDPIQVVEDCVYRAACKESQRTEIAPALDRWLEGRDAYDVIPVMNEVKRRFENSQEQSQDVSSLKEWCVNNHNVHLAFLMALVTEDWSLAGEVVSGDPRPTLHLTLSTLLAAVELTVQAKDFSAGAAIMSACPAIPLVGYKILCTEVQQSRELADKCAERELTDHALLIMRDDAEYIRTHHGSSQQRSLLDFILRNATTVKNWGVVRVLMDGCTDAGLLYYVHQAATTCEQGDIVQALDGRVDPYLNVKKI